MPSLDADTGLISMPIWMAGAVAALFLFVLIFALSRGSGGLLRAVGTVLIVALVGASAWTFLDRSALRDRVAERQGLDARTVQLTALALATGSPLACLDGLAGDGIETACEKAVFASPESTAAAVSYVSAKLALLADGMDFASRSDPAYASALVPLRLALEGDRYGIVAHVLAVRDSCTTMQCPMLALVQNATRIQANLKERTFESYVGRYAAEWQSQQVSAAETGGPVTTGHPVSQKYDFPSASSIPPVSIMSPEPPRPAASPPVAAVETPAPPAPATATPIPPRRPPPARAAQRPAPPPAPPAPLSAPRALTPPLSDQLTPPAAAAPSSQ